MNFNVNFNLFDCFRPHLRLVPGILDVREQTSTPRLTLLERQRQTGNHRGRLMMTFQMTDSQQATLTVSAKDKKGNAAPLPAGSVSWLVDNPAVLALTPAADGATCVVASMGPLGTATVSVKVSDSGGNALASGSIDVTVVGGAPTTLTVDPGTPTEQP